MVIYNVLLFLKPPEVETTMKQLILEWDETLWYGLILV